jgi:hypothetical protein
MWPVPNRIQQLLLSLGYRFGIDEPVAQRVHCVTSMCREPLRFGSAPSFLRILHSANSVHPKKRRLALMPYSRALAMTGSLIEGDRNSDLRVMDGSAPSESCEMTGLA